MAPGGRPDPLPRPESKQPAPGTLRRVNLASKGGVERLVGIMGAQAGEEGVQEGVQQLLQNIATRGASRPQPGPRGGRRQQRADGRPAEPACRPTDGNPPTPKLPLPPPVP